MAWIRARSSGIALAVLMSACSSLLGISDYEIDPSLDPQGGQPGGGSAMDAGGEAGAPPRQGDGGAPSGTAGTPGSAGETPGASGASEGGSGGSAQAGTGGTGGSGGGCNPASCDDEIECTVDSCGDDGKCVHTPDSGLCDADNDECVTCDALIGCVATPATKTQLLADPNLDLAQGDWTEDIQDSEQPFIINPDPAAHSAPNSAWWLAADPLADIQAYADLMQVISLPPKVKSLRVTGFYQQTKGLIAPSDDYAVAGLYRGNTKLIEFHTWSASSAPRATWTGFEYWAKPAELASLLQTLQTTPSAVITFDIYGYVWDSTFRYDTLSLDAFTCE
jgi:hypothetical protein